MRVFWSFVLLVLSLTPHLLSLRASTLDNYVSAQFPSHLLKAVAKDINVVPRAVSHAVWNGATEELSSALETVSSDFSMADLLLTLMASNEPKVYSVKAITLLDSLETEEGWAAFPEGKTSSIATADALRILHMIGSELPEDRLQKISDYLVTSVNHENVTLFDFIAAAEAFPLFPEDIRDPKLGSEIVKLPALLSKYILPDYLISLDTDRVLITCRSILALESTLPLLEGKQRHSVEMLINGMKKSLYNSVAFSSNSVNADGAAWISVLAKNNKLAQFVTVDPLHATPLKISHKVLLNFSLVLMISSLVLYIQPHLYRVFQLKYWPHKLLASLALFALYPSTATLVPYGGLVAIAAYGVIAFWGYRALSKLKTDAALICASGIAATSLLMTVLLSRMAPLALGRPFAWVAVCLVANISTPLILAASILLFGFKIKPSEAVDISMAGWSFGIGGTALVFWLRPTFQVLLNVSLFTDSFGTIFGTVPILSLSICFASAVATAWVLRNKGKTAVAKGKKLKKSLRTDSKKIIKK
ncbi:hypothetical protein RCL1_002752 [Eukaryota sp. TZLM3-RCL]